MLTFNLNLCHK